MYLTIWTKDGKRKSIHLPYEALDEVKKMVYNNREVIEYSICVSDYERIENELFEECN
jgi:hypothetical protein